MVPALVPHLFMVPLQQQHLLPQALQPHFQVAASDQQIVQNLPEVGDVSLHRLSHGQLVLIPGEKQTNVGFWFKSQRFKASCYHPSLLDSEVIDGQLGVVDGEDDSSILTSSVTDLEVEKVFFRELSVAEKSK